MPAQFLHLVLLSTMALPLVSAQAAQTDEITSPSKPTEAPRLDWDSGEHMKGYLADLEKRRDAADTAATETGVAPDPYPDPVSDKSQ